MECDENTFLFQEYLVCFLSSCIKQFLHMQVHVYTLANFLHQILLTSCQSLRWYKTMISSVIKSNLPSTQHYLCFSGLVSTITSGLISNITSFLGSHITSGLISPTSGFIPYIWLGFQNNIWHGFPYYIWLDFYYYTWLGFRYYIWIGFPYYIWLGFPYYILSGFSNIA